MQSPIFLVSVRIEIGEKDLNSCKGHVFGSTAKTLVQIQRSINPAELLGVKLKQLFDDSIIQNLQLYIQMDDSIIKDLRSRV